MKIAIISDMHGNCFSLEHVLDDIQRQGVDQLVCLGDTVQGGAQPAQTLARLRELRCPIVMGNADAWLLSGQETSPAETTSEQQQAVRAWSLAQLSESDQDVIRQFQPTVAISLGEDCQLLCFHGSPHSFDDIILPDTSDETVSQFMRGFNATFLSGGHTHTQQLRRVGQNWYLNPGSVSLPYNWERSKEGMKVDPWADYALLTHDSTGTGVTFRHVPLDIDELIRIMRASGRPYVEEAIALYLPA